MPSHTTVVNYMTIAPELTVLRKIAGIMLGLMLTGLFSWGVWITKTVSTNTTTLAVKDVEFVAMSKKVDYVYDRMLNARVIKFDR